MRDAARRAVAVAGRAVDDVVDRRRLLAGLDDGRAARARAVHGPAPSREVVRGEEDALGADALEGRRDARGAAGVRADHGDAQVAERVRRLAPQVARRGGDGVAGHAPPQQPLDDGPALAAVGAEDEVPHASTRRGEAMSSPALLPRNVLLRESART